MEYTAPIFKVSFNKTNFSSCKQALPYFILPDCFIEEVTVTQKNVIACFHLLGPLLGYPLRGVSTLIKSVKMEPGTSPAMVSACVSRCMLKVNHYGLLLHHNCELQEFQ